MKNLLLIFLFFPVSHCISQNSIDKYVMNSSRNSCVKIISRSGQSIGTGFYISNDIVATCFHVISTINIDSLKQIRFNIFSDLQAINENGDTVFLSCISVPNAQSPEPLFNDFALLKTNVITTNKSILVISNTTNQNVLDPIIFSGYPLETPAMVSHIGTISGITKDKSIISIQAATNKGNSGGALLDKEGKVIGIISLREGGISLGLKKFLDQIEESKKNGYATVMGIDPLQLAEETINVLDKYISTGIGYAINIKFLKDYLIKNNIKL